MHSRGINMIVLSIIIDAVPMLTYRYTGVRKSLI